MKWLSPKRASPRAQVTALLGDIDSSLQSEANEICINVFLARLTALQPKLTELDTDIEWVVADSDAEEVYSRRVEINNQVAAYIAKLDQKVKEAQLNRSFVAPPPIEIDQIDLPPIGRWDRRSITSECTEIRATAMWRCHSRMAAVVATISTRR